MKKSLYLATNGPFHGKCAFCEDGIRSNQHGDIEHFRPKGAVVDVATKMRILRQGSAEPHPGYYWLAYDWRNLLPACQLCNQPSTEPSGAGIGKRNYFPLADEITRAQRSGEEEQEFPLLINPTIEDPEPHLGIDGGTGVMFARDNSLRGAACLDILGLNLRDLPAARAEVYRNTRILFKALVDARFSRSVDLPHLEARLQAIVDGSIRFAAPARLAIADVKRELLAAMDAEN